MAPTFEPPRAEPAPPPPSESAQSVESRLLAAALQKLRRERDPSSALALLDEHRSRFPGGVLVSEAQVARVEALLALRRSADALALLDAETIAHLARAVELRVLRGELRAGEGRCREAIDDFGAVLDGAPTPDLVERSLWGRASCRSALGDEAGARADLDRQLARFPSGRLAADARKALGR